MRYGQRLRIVLLLIALAAAQELPLSWQENFDDTSRIWLYEREHGNQVKISGGHLHLSGARPGKPVVVAPCEPPFLDFTTDYDIEAAFRVAESESTFAYGIVCGGDDTGAFQAPFGAMTSWNMPMAY